MKIYIWTALGFTALGALVCWYFFPRYQTQIQTKTQVVTEYKNRIVEKIIERPDGSKETERITDQIGSQVSKETTQMQISKPDWMLSAIVSSNIVQFEPVYELGISRRVIGPVFAGVYVRTNKEAGIGLSLEF